LYCSRRESSQCGWTLRHYPSPDKSTIIAEVGTYDGEDDHSHGDAPVRGLNADVRAAVKTIVRTTGVTSATHIQHTLLTNSFPIDACPLSRLRSFIPTIVKDPSVPTNVAETAEFIKAHQYNNKLGDDDVFCIFNAEECLRNLLSFCICFTTRNLLRLVVNQASIGICNVIQDGTYKLCFESFPAHIIGFLDTHGTFIPTAFQLTRRENTPAYIKCLRRLKEFFIRLFKFEWLPSFSMNDNDKCFFNAVRDIWPTIGLGNCWTHFMRNLRDVKKAPSAFIEDLRLISTLHAMDAVQHALELFKRKWAHLSELLTKLDPFYFVADRIGWVMCNSDPGMRNHNQAMEGYNRHVKHLVTAFVRMTLSALLYHLWTFVSNESVIYSHIPLPTDPFLAPTHRERPWVMKRLVTTWSNAQVWALHPVAKPVIERIDVHGVIHTIHFSQTVYDTPSLHDNLSSRSVDDFDGYVFFKQLFWVVSSRMLPDGSWSSSCTCPPYLNTAVCKHCLGTLLRNNRIQVPLSMMRIQIPPNQKRGRGRPSIIEAHTHACMCECMCVWVVCVTTHSHICIHNQT